MLRKLLIAVLVLGLIFCLSSTAFSTDQIKDGSVKQVQINSPVNTINKGQNWPAISVPNFNKALNPVEMFEIETPLSTDKHLCEIQDFTDYTGGYYGIDWYGDDADIMAGRFTVAEANHTAVLYGAVARIYDASNTAGGCDFYVYVYDDAGGMPGALLYTESYPAGSFGPGYVLFPFTTPVNIPGNDYYIGFGTNGTGPAADYITIGTNVNADDTDNGRGWAYWSGGPTWMPLGDYFGQPMNFRGAADVCYEYSECSYYDGHTGSNGYTSNWGLPDPDWMTCCGFPGVLDGFGMEFTSGGINGADSIKYVTLQYLRPDIFGPTVYDEVTGTNGFIVSIWGDDAGDVDVASGPLAQVTVPGGFANLFPDYPSTWQFLEVDFTSFNLVLTGKWHVTVQTTSPDPADGQMFFAKNSTGSDPDFDAQGLSVNYHELGVDPDENWHRAPLSTFWTGLYGPGADGAYLIYVDYCKDEFYNCFYEPLHEFEIGSGFWVTPEGCTLPNDYGNIRTVAQKSGKPEGSRVSYVRFMPSLDDLFGLDPAANGDPIVHLALNADDGGLPGAELYGVDLQLSTGDLVVWPGWTEVVIPDVVFPGNFWVSLSVANDLCGGGDPYGDFNMVGDAGGVDAIDNNGGGMVYYRPWEEWISSTLFGYDANNWLIETEYCAVPPKEAVCDPANDNGWATYQGDQARTGASNLSLGDAWCKLNLNWNYQDASGLPITLASPVIYNDKVVITYGDADHNGRIVVIDLLTGLEVYTLTNTLGDGQLLGFDMRCTPTIVNMDIAGVPTDVMFIGGGVTNGVGAVDFATGALIWERTIISLGYDPTQLFGQTRFSTFMVLDQSGTMVLYYGTDAGKVVALEAETGALFAGWGTNNPVNLGYATLMSGTTDGVNVFFTYYTTAGDGDIVAIDAATGDISWQLSSAGGLQAVNLFTHENGYLTPEGFRAAVSYDDETGQLFACSYANLDAGGSDHPTDGVMYFIDAATGNLNNFVASNRSLYATPTVDKINVFVPTYTKWAAPPAGGNLLSYDKTTGVLNYAATGVSAGRYYMSGIRTCEPDGVDDLFIVFNEDGMLEFWNSVTGELMFTRRVDHDNTFGSNIGLGGALAADSDGIAHLVFVDFSGGVYDMVMGEFDRQRADFYTYRILAAADFGPASSIAVDFGPLFYNNGCADLAVTSVLSDEATFGGRILGFAAKNVDDDKVLTANSIADDLTFEAVKGMIGENERTLEANLTDSKLSKSTASANPDWLNGVIAPAVGDVLAAGEEANLILDVNQVNLTRGVLQAFVQIGTDDPDFFLNEGMDVVGQNAEVLVTLIGGCLLDTTTLHFGPGGANYAWVTNTMMLGDGDWAPPFYEIDGDNGTYYQGAMGYANSKYAVAINVSDWWSNTDDQFVSIQADPVWCATQECAPTMVTGVNVGAMSTDGLTYDPIIADYVCKTFIDSVQNFDRDPDPLVTDWIWYAAGPLTQYLPFDDTLTMGLTCNSRMFGVQDNPALGNFVFEIFEFQNRNAEEVNNWAMCHIFDPDGEYVYSGTGGDASYIDRANSICWTAPLGWSGSAMFSVKVPFGCGELDGVDDDWDFQPVWNAWGFIDLFNPMDGIMDTMHYAMTNYIGVISNNVTADDSKGMYTLARHNFEPNGTYSLGIAHGQFVDLTENLSSVEMAPTAHLINKWAGFGRGDVNNDNAINLGDIIYLSSTINGGPGAIPFAHLSDVNADGLIDANDLDYMIQYYFYCGPCPLGDWMF